MNAMLPSLDRRIAALIDLKRKVESEGIPHNQTGKVITLSREFGCEAYRVAHELKEKLEKLTKQEWTVFKEGTIEQTSPEKVLSANLDDDFGDHNRYLEAIIAALMPNWKTQVEYYSEVVKTIVAIAHRGNAILVGRGASAITRDLPNCYHFRLIGGKELRAKRYAEKHQVTLKEAQKIVVEKEKARMEFLERFLGTQYNPHNFHLIFNKEKVSIDRIVDTIISFVFELH